MIGHIFCRNRRLKDAVDGKMERERERDRQTEMSRGQERRRKQLLVDSKKKRGHCKLKEEALDHTILRTFFLRGKGLNTKLVN